MVAESSGEDVSDEEYTGRSKGGSKSALKKRGRKPKFSRHDEGEDEEAEEDAEEEEEVEEPAPKQRSKKRQAKESITPASATPTPAPAPVAGQMQVPQMYFPGQGAPMNYGFPQFNTQQPMQGQQGQQPIYYMAVPPLQPGQQQQQGYDPRYQQPVFYAPPQGSSEQQRRQ